MINIEPISRIPTTPKPAAKPSLWNLIFDEIDDRLKKLNEGKQNIGTMGIPTGALVYFAMISAPSGYLKANGAVVSRTVYADLFAIIGVNYGIGDGISTFQLPTLSETSVNSLDDVLEAARSALDIATAAVNDANAQKAAAQSQVDLYRSYGNGNFNYFMDQAFAGIDLRDTVPNPSGERNAQNVVFQLIALQNNVQQLEASRLEKLSTFNQANIDRVSVTAPIACIKF